MIYIYIHIFVDVKASESCNNILQQRRNNPCRRPLSFGSVIRCSPEHEYWVRHPLLL